MRIIPEAILLQKNPTNDPEIEYLQDVWRLSVVGIKPLPYIRAVQIKFNKVETLWLKELAKHFIRFESATKALYTLQQYINAVRHFSNFIQEYEPRATAASD